MNLNLQPVMASPEIWSQFVKPRKEPRPYFVTVKELNRQCPITSIVPSASETFDSSIPVNRPDSGTILNASPSLKVVHGDVGNAYSKRVMQYLALAESKEVLVSLRDDYRIAWLTVLHASEGMLNAWEFSFWQYLGKHPQKLIPEFVAREERHKKMNVPDYDPAQDKRRA